MFPGSPSLLETPLMGSMLDPGHAQALFGEAATLQRWLDVEAALALAEAELGVIPAEAAATIAAACRLEVLDREALAAAVAVARHPLVPVLAQLTAACGEAGAWLHWGATTQDITDTALALQMAAAADVMDDALARLEAALRQTAAEHADTLMMGRTHGQHALPTTFGGKVALWALEVVRQRRRIRQARPRFAVGELGGGAGTLASLGSKGAAVRRALCRRLALTQPDGCWHAARDGVAEFALVMSMAAGTAGKIGHELAALQATERAEVEEAQPPGSVGSSTMPQKRNPMLAEAVQSLAQVATSAASQGLAAWAHEHERDWARLVAEWDWVPRTAVASLAAVSLCADVVEGLEVKPERMATNAGLLRGLGLSEAVMLEVGKRVGRGRAHDLMHEAARRVQEEGTSLQAELAAGELGRLLGKAELRRLLDPRRYLGEAPALARRVGSARDRARS